MYHAIRLTPAEADLWNWAVDPMAEFWADEEERPLEGEAIYPHGTAILTAENGVGRIADDPSVADDLIYRIETQMSGMAIEQGGIDHRGRGDRERMTALASVATGRRLATKVRIAFGLASGDCEN